MKRRLLSAAGLALALAFLATTLQARAESDEEGKGALPMSGSFGNPLMAALLAACLAAASVAAARAETTLRVWLNSDIRSTEPGVNRDANTDAVLTHIFEGLVAFREDASVGPLLAESIDVSADGLVYTFHLRDHITFHNGAPMTADDVVWSWRRYLDPATEWRCLPEVDGHGATKILAVEAVDPKTVAFRLERPSALFLTTMARPDCGEAAILHHDSVGPDGKWRGPIAAGPFKIGEWEPGQYVELDRFDGYASRSGERDGETGGKKALVDKVRFLIIPDPSAAKAAILAGALDILADVAPAELADFENRPDIRIDRAPTMNMYAIILQTKDSVLKDARIRRALAMSIDYPSLVDAVTHGASQANNSAVPSSSPFYDAAQASGFSHDLAEARKLLAEAAYSGQRIKLVANKRYAEMFDQAMLVQAMAAEVGLNVDVEVTDWASELDRYAKGDYQAMSFSYSARLDPSLNYDVFTGPKASEPRKVWDDAKIQALLEASMRTNDAKERQTIFDEMHRAMLADVPLIPLFNATLIGAVRKNVVGYKGWAGGLPRYWNVGFGS
jgi:peptide/nickel transport system substrate-binding protein